MMLPTHMLMGGLIGLVSLILNPSETVSLFFVGMVGGLIPDLDIFLEHRKDLHRPYQFLILTTIGFGISLYMGGYLVLLGLSVLFGSMTAHCFIEILSNGKTMRPSKEKDERAVYNHFRNRWIKPRRVATDGSFPDLLIAVLSGVSILAVSKSLVVSTVTLVLLCLGILYFLFSKRLKKKLAGYDRYSEFLQHLLGWGPETKS